MDVNEVGFKEQEKLDVYFIFARLAKFMRRVKALWCPRKVAVQCTLTTSKTKCLACFQRFSAFLLFFCNS